MIKTLLAVGCIALAHQPLRASNTSIADCYDIPYLTGFSVDLYNGNDLVAEDLSFADLEHDYLFGSANVVTTTEGYFDDDIILPCYGYSIAGDVPFDVNRYGFDNLAIHCVFSELSSGNSIFNSYGHFPLFDSCHITSSAGDIDDDLYWNSSLQLYSSFMRLEGNTYGDLNIYFDFTWLSGNEYPHILFAFNYLNLDRLDTDYTQYAELEDTYAALLERYHTLEASLGEYVWGNITADCYGNSVGLIAPDHKVYDETYMADYVNGSEFRFSSFMREMQDSGTWTPSAYDSMDITINVSSRPFVSTLVINSKYGGSPQAFELGIDRQYFYLEPVEYGSNSWPSDFGDGRLTSISYHITDAVFDNLSSDTFVFEVGNAYALGYAKGYNDARGAVDSSLQGQIDYYKGLVSSLEAQLASFQGKSYQEIYNMGYAAASQGGVAITSIFSSILSVPFTILNGLTPMVLFDFPVIKILITFVFIGVLLWVIRRLFLQGGGD